MFTTAKPPYPVNTITTTTKIIIISFQSNEEVQKMSLTFKLKMVFSVLCFFFKPAGWHLLLYQYRSIHFDAHISKEHSPIKSCVPCAPFILWAPAPPKVSARPWFRVFLFISHKIINWLLLLKIICLNYIFTFVRRTVQKLDFFAVHTFYHIFQYRHTNFIFIFYYSRDLPANYQNKALCVSQNVLTIMMACFHSKSYGWLIIIAQ